MPSNNKGLEAILGDAQHAQVPSQHTKKGCLFWRYSLQSHMDEETDDMLHIISPEGGIFGGVPYWARQCYEHSVHMSCTAFLFASSLKEQGDQIQSDESGNERMEKFSPVGTAKAPILNIRILTQRHQRIRVSRTLVSFLLLRVKKRPWSNGVTICARQCNTVTPCCY